MNGRTTHKYNLDTFVNDASKTGHEDVVILVLECLHVHH